MYERPTKLNMNLFCHALSKIRHERTMLITDILRLKLSIVELIAPAVTLTQQPLTN